MVESLPLNNCSTEPATIEIRSVCLAVAALIISAAVEASTVVRAVRPRLLADPKAAAYPSNLMVDREVSVTTRVSGVIESIQAERGQFVRKGEPLATLDQSEFQLDLQAAEETFRLRKAEYERHRELFEQKLTSQAELDERKARFELARVELDRARLVFHRSVIRAPYDGVIVERFARVGQKVLVDEDVPLFKITALEPMIARAYLPEQMLGRVKTGQPVQITASEFPSVKAKGRVTFLSPVVEPGSGSFQVIVTVDRDESKVLRPGMAVQLSFDGGGRLMLPASVLTEPARARFGGKATVFEVNGQRLKRREIEFVPAGGSNIEVRAGVSANAWIVDHPSPELRDGQRVEMNH